MIETFRRANGRKSGAAGEARGFSSHACDASQRRRVTPADRERVN
jgi:hypothetical protein